MIMMFVKKPVALLDPSMLLEYVNVQKTKLISMAYAVKKAKSTIMESVQMFAHNLGSTMKEFVVGDTTIPIM